MWNLPEPLLHRSASTAVHGALTPVSHRLDTPCVLAEPSILLVLEALGWLAAARLLLALVPFPRISPRLGTVHPPMPVEPLPEQQRQRAQCIAGAIARAAELAPVQMLCLPRAFAARQMLALRGLPSRLHIGASRTPSVERALTHAWLDSGDVEVTGYPVAYAFTELGFFLTLDSRGVRLLQERRSIRRARFRR